MSLFETVREALTPALSYPMVTLFPGGPIGNDVGLSPAAIRRMLTQQLYLARFLDFRFRPAVQVDQKQIEDYYRSELLPPLQARGQTLPSIESVAETIREVLVQRAISARAAQWLDETRQRVKIDIAPEEAEP